MTISLTRDDPELLALEAAYAALNLPFQHSLWGQWVEHIKADGMNTFRGEGFYLAQVSLGMTPERYQNTYGYLVSIGEGETIKYLGEDGAFGCETFPWDGMLISRDLLDSARELRFLRETFHLTDGYGFELLDIGPGYGRLMYRFNQAFPAGACLGIDAVPLSTFLCSRYLDYRHIGYLGDTDVSCQSHVVPLDNLKQLKGRNLSVACNIHSFSEQPLASVNYWLDLCVRLNIPYFFLVPHSQDFCHASFHTTEVDNSHLDYYPAFAAHGYKEMRREFKYPPELSEQMVFNTQYLMFQREAS